MLLADLQLPPDPPAQVQAPAKPSFDDQYAKARALANGGQPELALAAYSALLARSPGNVDVLLGRGIVYARLKRWAEAEADLEAAAKASPGYADVWSALGNSYQWSDQPAKAVDAYGHLLALRPDDPEAWLARARAYRTLERLGEARADLDKARALGGSGAAYDDLAEQIQLQLRGGNPDAVIAAGYTWAAGLSSDWTDVGTGPRWNDQTLSVRHYGKQGSIAFESLRAHRFGEQDEAWALDAYTNLWQGAYANLRYQRSPNARLFPANSGRAELYQSLGHGWEVSASDDVLGFAGRVNIYGVTVARYAGDFYLQLRHQDIVSPGSHGSGERLLGRWYYAGDADSYFELSVNSGRSDDPLSLVGGQARSGGGGFNLVRYWTPVWGARVGASISRASDASNQRELSFALYRRW
jgi:YaiO family outer membrane protein